MTNEIRTINVNVNPNTLWKADASQKYIFSADGVNQLDESEQPYQKGTLLEKDKYVLGGGATVDSKYGYAAEFDSMARDYTNAVMHGKNYSDYTDTDIVSNMNEKYNQLKEEIENTYEGAEREDRLKELDASYDAVVNNNIVKPLEHAIWFETMANQLRAKLGSFHDRAKEQYGEEAANRWYANMSGWQDVCKDIDDQMESYRKLFEDLKKALQKSRDTEGAGQYADSLLKTLNAGLAGLEEKKTTFRSELEDGKNKDVGELWDLVERKAEIFWENDRTYASDEEKYQAFLKGTVQSEGIDSRIEEILKKITSHN